IEPLECVRFIAAFVFLRREPPVKAKAAMNRRTPKSARRHEHRGGGWHVHPDTTSPCTPFVNLIHCKFAVCGLGCRLAVKVYRRMNYDPANPLIVQGDRSVLVEVDNPRYAEARDALAPFAELEKSPEHIHTYRLTPLSLWNAAAAGLTAEAMVDALRRFSKFPLPTNLATDIAELVSRYGRVRLERSGEKLRLVCSDRPLLEELVRQPRIREFLGE